MQDLSDSFIGEDTGSPTAFPGDLEMLSEFPKFIGLRAGVLNDLNQQPHL